MYKDLLKGFIKEERNAVNLLLESVDNKYDAVIDMLLKMQR